VPSFPRFRLLKNNHRVLEWHFLEKKQNKLHTTCLLIRKRIQISKTNYTPDKARPSFDSIFPTWFVLREEYCWLVCSERKVLLARG
jgi:hypothetical protein